MGIACHGCSDTTHMAADARSNAFQLTFYQLCYSALDPWPAGSTVEDFASRLVPARFQLELIKRLGLLPGC